MAKRGRKNHVKRMAVPRAVPIRDKKAKEWMISSSAGPHSKKESMPLAVLLRDVLKVVKTASEAKKVLDARKVLVDGTVRISPRLPVGIMDVVSMPDAGKHYRLVVDWKGRLVPLELDEKQASGKILKVIGKRTVPGGKLSVHLHDGRNMLADNHIKVGDSVRVKLPEVKLDKHLKLEKGARCLVREGKHAGIIATLEEIIERKAGKPNEAKVKTKDKEFITVAKYLMVVDGDFKVVE